MADKYNREKIKQELTQLLNQKKLKLKYGIDTAVETIVGEIADGNVKYSAKQWLEDTIRNYPSDVKKVKDAVTNNDLKEMVSQYCHIPVSLIRIESDNSKEIVYTNNASEVIAKYLKRNGQLLVVKDGKTKDGKSMEDIRRELKNYNTGYLEKLSGMKNVSREEMIKKIAGKRYEAKDTDVSVKAKQKYEQLKKNQNKETARELKSILKSDKNEDIGSYYAAAYEAEANKVLKLRDSLSISSSYGMIKKAFNKYGDKVRITKAEKDEIVKVLKDCQDISEPENPTDNESRMLKDMERMFDRLDRLSRTQTKDSKLIKNMSIHELDAEEYELKRELKNVRNGESGPSSNDKENSKYEKSLINRLDEIEKERDKKRKTGNSKPVKLKDSQKVILSHVLDSLDKMTKILSKDEDMTEDKVSLETREKESAPLPEKPAKDSDYYDEYYAVTIQSKGKSGGKILYSGNDRKKADKTYQDACKRYSEEDTHIYFGRGFGGKTYEAIKVRKWKDSVNYNYVIKGTEYKGKIKIDIQNDYFDKSDYAFYDDKTKQLSSYNDVAKRFVENALREVSLSPSKVTPGFNKRFKNY